jgi:hypothetical protein
MSIAVICDVNSSYLLISSALIHCHPSKAKLVWAKAGMGEGNLDMGAAFDIL